jgi:hypothetical protein
MESGPPAPPENETTYEPRSRTRTSKYPETFPVLRRALREPPLARLQTILSPLIAAYDL